MKNFRASVLQAITVIALLSGGVLAHAQEDAAVDDGSLPVIPLTPAPEPQAQSAAAEEPVELETVIVIGEKMGRTLEQTATSASVTSGRQLEDYGDDSISDLMDRVANVSSSAEGAFSIRGVSDAGASGFGDGQPVISTYIDGIAVDPSGQQGAVLDTFDVDQVEILRGAQSTSQGRNALAGAVVVTTRAPTDYWDLHTRLRFAQRGERQYAAAGGGPLGAGFGFRVVGDLQQSDGFITNTTLNDPEWNAEDRSTLRGKLGWRSESTPGLGVLLTSGRTEQKGRRPTNFENDDEQPQARRTATENEPGYNEVVSLPTSLRIDVPLGETFKLTATSGYIDSDLVAAGDLDRTSVDNGVSYFHNQGRNLSQELRINFHDWHNLSGLFGVYGGRFETDLLYQFRDALIHGYEVLPVPVIGELVNIRADGNDVSTQKADNVAIFTEIDWAATERLTVTTGLRYDHERSKSYTLYEITRADGYPTTGGQIDLVDQLLDLLPGVDLLPVVSPAGLSPGTGGGQRASASYHALLPKLGLRYALTDALNVFAHYVEGYRAGGADFISSTGTLNIYDPEYTATVETGFRAAWWDRRLNTRFNVYYTDWKDQQVSLPSDDGLTYYTQNAASSKLYGAELENTLRLSERWSAYLSLGYAHTEFREYTNNGNDYSDNEFVNSPAFSGSAGTSWRWQRWFAAASFSYAEPGYGNPDNSALTRTDTRRTLDTRLGYEIGHWSVLVFARNLLDADYRTYRYHYEKGLSVEEPSSLIGYGEPRTVGMQVDWHW